MMTIEKCCLQNNDWQRDIVFSCYISYFIEWSFYKSSYCMHVFVSIVVPLVMSPWGYHHDPDNPLLVLYFKNKSSRSSQENKMLPEKNIFVVLMMQPKIDQIFFIFIHHVQYKFICCIFLTINIHLIDSTVCNILIIEYHKIDYLKCDGKNNLIFV